MPISKPKVTVMGAAGGIGQPLSMLMKLSPYVGELSLYDVVATPGVACDLSHINSDSPVKGYCKPEDLAECLSGTKLVIIPAGVPRKPGMTRDDLFNINAGIVKGLIEACGKYCPDAVLAIISNPVNSTVPIAAETLKAMGIYDKKKVVGVTTLDVVRANTFVGEVLKVDPAQVNVPVIGGHAGTTILPVLSASTPPVLDALSTEEAAKLTDRIQNAGTEVVDAKEGRGSATLSMAFAAARFGESVLKGLAGEEGIVECAYVESELSDCQFFASQVRLGVDGVAEYYPLPALNDAEKANYESMKGDLTNQIAKGVKFITEPAK